MDMVRELKASFLGDGIADVASFDVRNLPDCNFHTFPVNVSTNNENVAQATVSGFTVTFVWRKDRAPDKGELETVHFVLHFQG